MRAGEQFNVAQPFVMDILLQMDHFALFGCLPRVVHHKH